MPPSDRGHAAILAGRRLRAALPHRRSWRRWPDAAGWRLIEDSCEALGLVVDGRPLGLVRRGIGLCLLPEQADHDRRGRHGRDGRSDELASVMRSLRNQGRDEDGTWLRHVRLGYNYRIDELSAALGVAQLGASTSCARARAGRGHAYAEALAELEWLSPAVGAAGGRGRLVRVRGQVTEAIDRDRLIEQLGGARRTCPPVLRPDPSPAVLPRTVRPCARRLSGDRAGRRADARHPVLVSTDRRRRRARGGGAPRRGRRPAASMSQTTARPVPRPHHPRHGRYGLDRR